MSFRIGFGVDFHQLATGRPFWLGGVLIPFAKGAVGHSDADVLLHAICDALLGSVGLGDIGVHFPNTDPAFKNIDSKILLKKTFGLVENLRYRVVNLDTTVCLQEPKIGGYIQEMRSIIAPILQVRVHDISIKATTTEGMGYVGRKEGVVAYASTLVESV